MKYTIVFLFISASYIFGQENINSDKINIRSKRQLFIDNYLLEKISDGVQLQMHNPISKEIAIKHDSPWEGNGSAYHSVFMDGDIYRMYYRGRQMDIDSLLRKMDISTHYYCYAESTDGINWTKPNLGLYEFNGSKENNIILASKEFVDFNFKMGDNASFFKDENPNVIPSEQYKGFVLSSDPRGLLALKSEDGIHWKFMSKKPVITDGAFDSQNVGFWDDEIGAYRAYWRYFHRFVEKDKESMYKGVRSIRTATSKDFITWENQKDLEYVNSPHEELYTNQIFPYYRAHEILIGFPSRYIERGWSQSMEKLPEYKHRKLRSSINNRYGMAISDGLFMSSRDGVLFNRWNEAFLPPGIERPGTWNYGHQFIASGVLETKSSLSGAPNELSIYSIEGFWTDDSNQLRRYTLRMDGFVSVSASYKGGEIVTKPFKFEGERLFINFSTSAEGSMKFEIQDENGEAIPGFSLEECPDIFGDSLNREIIWNRNHVPGDLLDKNIRLRILLKDADLYSFKFNK